MMVMDAATLLKFIDLTSLNDEDDQESILKLLNYSHCSYGHVAAICVYSKFIPIVLNYINQQQLPVNLATVVNFPGGGANLLQVKYEIIDALNAGANEIDLVLPYQELMLDNVEPVHNMLAMARELCSDNILKVIIESGELSSDRLIKRASEMCIEHEVDFIKTSTGKKAIGATLDAATVILNTIKDSGRNCGFKVSGGISSIAIASQYYGLVKQILGSDALRPERFRIGTSKLVKELIGD